MREIKFRVYSKKFKGMIYHGVDGYTIDVHAGTVWQDSRDDESAILMQFTGLKDKNGVEIYEGDVGQIKTQSGRIENFVVQWGIHRREMKSGWTVDIPSFCFEIDGFPSFPIVNNYLNGHDLDIIEIIGNIYSNPELLTTPTGE